MVKQTMVPIRGKGYKIVHGEKTNTSGQTIELSFDTEIAMIFYTAYTKLGNTERVLATGYGVNSNSSFFDNTSGMFDNTYPESKPKVTQSGSSAGVVPSFSNNKIAIINFSGVSSTNYFSKIIYTAVLVGNDSIDESSIFLLNGTTLYTDGTVTSEVEGAIQTLEENKYKIKSNALVNIADATYINLSN